jgi:hypothetical protein
MVDPPQPMVVPPTTVPVQEFVRPTQVARARNHTLLGLVWLPVAAIVVARAVADPALSTAWIALVVALSAGWVAVDAVGSRFVDRVVVAHDRVHARVHGTLEISDFEVVAGAGVTMECTSFGSRLRRHRYINLWWPGEDECRTIRLDVFAKNDQAKIVRRLTELTKPR